MSSQILVKVPGPPPKAPKPVALQVTQSQEALIPKVKVNIPPVLNTYQSIPFPPVATTAPTADTKVFVPEKKRVNPKFWKWYRVAGKTREAKFLQLPFKADTYDLFCVARTDNEVSNQFKSIIISNSDNPFWNENFTLDSRVVFKVLKFTVWMASKSELGDVINVPVGKVVIPRKFMKSKDEQCYMLVDATLEDQVSGVIQIEIQYQSPEETKTKHVFTVKIIKAKDLAMGNKNILPYVVTHLLPDNNLTSKKQTSSSTKTCNPVFPEEPYMYYADPEEDPFKLDMHVSVWDKRSDEAHKFLGHVNIPLGPLTELHSVKKYFKLTTLRNDELLSPKKSGKQQGGFLATELAKSLASENFPPLTERDHNFLAKAGTGHCAAGCNEPFSSSSGGASMCTDCKVYIHSKCQYKVPATCGGYGNFRFTVDFKAFISLDMPFYEPILQVLKKDNYQVLVVMGKVSNYREEVARCLLKVYNEQYVNFLNAVLRKEILDAESVQTLFRSNSIASKALDVFMKHEGAEYLKEALESSLKTLNQATSNYELDPTRMNKDESGAIIEDGLKNAISLSKSITIVLDSIFNSAHLIPDSFRAIFSTIQKTVGERFPNNELTRYISISGFIFLRFFTPAIFGPTLFNLKIGVQDDKSKRRFTLVAKTLQNLSNFAEFGRKESFMEPMNTFIKSKMQAMRTYIDTISTNTSDFVAKAKAYEPEVVAKDTADLIRYIALSMDKVLHHQPTTDVVKTDLPQALADLQKIIKKFDQDFDGW